MDAEYRAFQQLCRARRRALSPADVGLPERPKRPGPQVVGLLQVEVDLLMGRGMGTYQKVESGAWRPSPSYLCQLAQVLRFKESEFVQSHLDLFGTAPGQPLYPDDAMSIPPGYKEKVAGQRHICYIQNRRWEPVYWNSAYVDLFPSKEVPSNLALWWFTSDEARDPDFGVMINWDEFWGPLLVPQFRASVSAYRDDPVLREINEIIQKDKRIQRLYERGENAYIHPDGDRRPLRHGTLGPGYGTLLSETLQSAPGCREMTVLFHPDANAAAA